MLLKVPTSDGVPCRLPVVELTDMPKLLMWGMKDWCFRPECLDRFVGHWPDAEVHRYDDGGHYVLEDKRDQILPAVSEFLDRHET